MLRLSLLLTFIGLAVSAERPSLDGTSLLGMIRNDPNALVKIFETATADKDKVNTIIRLLGNLINEARSEVRGIGASIKKAKNETQRAKTLYQAARAHEIQSGKNYNDAKQATAKALGRLNANKKIYAAEAPTLKKESEVFYKVLRILQSLLKGKDLVEEDSEQVKAFISVDDQADPVKVKRIIALLTKLLQSSNDELGKLTQNVKDAKKAWEKAVAKENDLKGIWDATKKSAYDKQKLWNNAAGREAVIVRRGNARIKVLSGEIGTINSVIALLKQLL